MISFDIKESAAHILQVGDLVVRCYPKNNIIRSPGLDRQPSYNMSLVLESIVTTFYSMYKVYSLFDRKVTSTNMQAGLSDISLSGSKWSESTGMRCVRIQDIIVTKTKMLEGDWT